MSLLAAALVLMLTLLATTVMIFREKSFAERAPFIIATLASAVIYNAVEKRQTQTAWWLIPIVLVLLPLIPSAIKKGASDETTDS